MRTLVPKGPSVTKPVVRVDDFDRAKALDYLFSLPLPPRVLRGKPYPITTPLGRIMWLKGLQVRDVDHWEGAPNYRRLCEYLAGREEIKPHHRAVLARELGVDPRVL